MADISDIKKNIELIRAGIPDHVTILAAAKTRTVAEVRAAHTAGIRAFGHNYVQEASRMLLEIDFEARWHLIGHLQRNKAKQAVSLFDTIDSLDSLRLAKELEKRCAELDRHVDVLIEVNSGREENKTGVLPQNAPELAEFLNGCQCLHLRGLMTMGPLMGDPELARPYYQETRRIAEEIDRMRLSNVEMGVLSMGMSNSYMVAIEEGANQVRLGTVIFGPRH